MSIAIDSAFAARLPPGRLRTTWNKREPGQMVRMRAAELPGMIALPVRALVPWLPEPIWSAEPAYGHSDIGGVRDRARATVERMDWSKIRPCSRVNVLANPHGFFMGGEAYVVMLEEIVRHIKDTKQASVRLCVAESMGHIENVDWAKAFDLKARFDKFEEVPQCAAGTPVDTRLGRFWLMKHLFNADHFVHTHISEMREGYLHRMRDRLFKPFGMSYVRLETRSAYHFGYGPRTGQLVSRVIFDSDFIQKKYAGSVVLTMTPEGVTGIDGDYDLMALDKRLTVETLRNYGTLFGLLAELDKCVVICESQYPSIYNYGGGIIMSSLSYADVDYFDLDNLAAVATPDTAHIKPETGLVYGRSKKIGAIVVNYMSGGLPHTQILEKCPLFLVGDEMYNWTINDPANTYMEAFAIHSPDLPTAVADACRAAGTDCIMAFDNTQGAFRVSRNVADRMLERAPAVQQNVLQNKMPKWLAQRRIA